jgi:carbohydrate-binding DOMON domain-containing protein
VTGNIAVYPGTSVTGFGPAVLHGVMDLGNAAGLAAQSAVTAAYITAAAMVPTADLTGQDLGGMIHTYTHTHTHTNTHTHIHTYIHKIYIHTNMHTYIHTLIYTHTQV